MLTEGRIRAIAGRSAGEDNLFDEGIERELSARWMSIPITSTDPSRRRRLTTSKLSDDSPFKSSSIMPYLGAGRLARSESFTSRNPQLEALPRDGVYSD